MDIQACDCLTWWNHKDGKYSTSPAFSVTFKVCALRYSGYLKINVLVFFS